MQGPVGDTGVTAGVLFRALSPGGRVIPRLVVRGAALWTHPACPPGGIGHLLPLGAKAQAYNCTVGPVERETCGRLIQGYLAHEKTPTPLGLP